ncbi:hypothetical protein HanIR_Chr09g0395381 [Helianthus annuus]|nr:hypothetical protein HanIR_Chr09g0395381 [Helianthus annuus]
MCSNVVINFVTYSYFYYLFIELSPPEFNHKIEHFGFHFLNNLYFATWYLKYLLNQCSYDLYLLVSSNVVEGAMR